MKSSTYGIIYSLEMEGTLKCHQAHFSCNAHRHPKLHQKLMFHQAWHWASLGMGHFVFQLGYASPVTKRQVIVIKNIAWVISPCWNLNQGPKDAVHKRCNTVSALLWMTKSLPDARWHQILGCQPDHTSCREELSPFLSFQKHCAPGSLQTPT